MSNQPPKAALVEVHACDGAECERPATREVVDAGKHLAWFCDTCIGEIEGRLAAVAGMVGRGTPLDVAERWSRKR